MKKILVLIVLCGVALWAARPVTARFCADIVMDDDEHLKFDLRLLNNVVPDSKWKLPDSLPCGSVGWKNSIAFTYGSREFILTGRASDISEHFSCKLCADDKRLQKKATFKPYIDELHYSYYKRYDEEKKSVDQKSLENLYGKKMKAVWNGAYSCYCPSYELPKWSTSLDIVIEGECPPVEENVVDSTSKGGSGGCSVDDSLENDEGEFVAFGQLSSLSKTLKNSPVDSTPAEGLFACYRSYASEYNHPVEAYASFKPMNMVDDPKGSEESLECFEVNGERFLVYGTNVPGMFYSTSVSNGRYYGGNCYLSKGDFKKMETVEKPFYTCGYGNTSSRGCKAVPHGMDVVVNMDMKYEGWNRKDLWFYAELMNAENVDAFITKIEYHNEKKELLPRNITAKAIVAIGDDAARKTAGMAFYNKTKKVKYEKYARNHFSSLKEAIGACKNFQFESFIK